MGSQLWRGSGENADEAHSRRVRSTNSTNSAKNCLGSNVIQLMNAIPNYIVESFEAGAAELFLRRKKSIYRSGYGAVISIREMKTRSPAMK